VIDPSVADFDPAADPVDWGFVRTVAKRFSGTESASGAVLAARFRHDMAEHTAFAEAAVAEFTGLGAIAAPATVRCVDRSEWVGANADSYMDLLRSLYLRYPKLIKRVSTVSRVKQPLPKLVSCSGLSPGGSSASTRCSHPLAM